MKFTDHFTGMSEAQSMEFLSQLTKETGTALSMFETAGFFAPITMFSVEGTPAQVQAFQVAYQTAFASLKDQQEQKMQDIRQARAARRNTWLTKTNPISKFLVDYPTLAGLTAFVTLLSGVISGAFFAIALLQFNFQTMGVTSLLIMLSGLLAHAALKSFGCPRLA
jgi:uncharacterized membrane protein